jgi:chloramphenicol 3-O phosphotransferase
LARALQSALPDPWLLLGIDLFIWTLPPYLINDPRGLSVFEGVITRGDVFMALYSAFQRSVATLVANGVDVILDDVALDGVADQQRWVDALKGFEVFWIGVRCAPEIAAEREARRQSRLPGTARNQALVVHSDVRYDIDVDTGHQDIAEEVSEVVGSLNLSWGLQISHRTNEQFAPPPISAWTPGEVLRPPLWEG